MAIDHTKVKLGKKPAVIDPRTLRLKKYLKKPVLPAPPKETSWITKLVAAEPIPMYLNDQLGDCVAAMGGHMIQQMNFYAGHPFRPTDADVLKVYEDVGGYVPGNPSTDNGMDILSFMNYWRKTGIGGHKILAFVAVDFENLDEVQIAIELFGSVAIGIQLPVSAQGADDWIVPDGGIYSNDGQPGSWGGHGIPLVAGSPITKTCETWGSTLKMSNNFALDYIDEAYAVLSKDWLDAGLLSPGAINLPQLEADLDEIGALIKPVRK